MTVIRNAWVRQGPAPIQPKNGSSFQRRGARAQSNAEKKWIVVEKNGNDNFSDGVNLHPLGVDDKVLKKRR